MRSTFPTIVTLSPVASACSGPAVGPRVRPHWRVSGYWGPRRARRSASAGGAQQGAPLAVLPEEYGQSAGSMRTTCHNLRHPQICAAVIPSTRVGIECSVHALPVVRTSAVSVRTCARAVPHRLPHSERCPTPAVQHSMPCDSVLDFSSAVGLLHAGCFVTLRLKFNFRHCPSDIQHLFPVKGKSAADRSGLGLVAQSRSCRDCCQPAPGPDIAHRPALWAPQRLGVWRGSTAAAHRACMHATQQHTDALADLLPSRVCRECMPTTPPFSRYTTHSMPRQGPVVAAAMHKRQGEIRPPSISTQHH